MWPHSHPVSAPNAPVRAHTRNSAIPNRPHCGSMKSAFLVARPSDGMGRSAGGGGRGAGAASGADRAGVQALVDRAQGGLTGGRAQQVAEGAGLVGELVAWAVLDDAPALEHGDLLGPLRGREPVGDQQTGAPVEQTLGSGDDAGLGERVHPGGRLVQDDDPDVADQESSERDQLLLAGGEARATGSEQGVETLGEPRDPGRETELLA